MTSQRVERTWIRTGGYGRFRGEWVKLFIIMKNINWGVELIRNAKKYFERIINIIKRII